MMQIVLLLTPSTQPLLRLELKTTGRQESEVTTTPDTMLHLYSTQLGTTWRWFVMMLRPKEEGKTWQWATPRLETRGAENCTRGMICCSDDVNKMMVQGSCP